MTSVTTPSEPTSTKDESTSRSVTTQQDASASMHPAVTAFLASSTPETTKRDLSSPMTTQLPSTLDQNADLLHKSVVVTAGNSFSLSCASPVETKFRWAYCRFGSRELKIIYNGGRFTTDFHVSTKVSVPNCDVKNCTFNVDNVQLADAGFFTCTGPPVSKYWSITILGK